MNPPWRSRLNRADEHLEEVKLEVDRFLSTNPYRIIGKNEPHPIIPKMINYRVIGYIDKTPDSRLGDVIGDCVGNLRSCLDLIAYNLASQGGPPPQGTELAPDVQAAIERLQPYNGVDSTDFAVAGPQNIPESVLKKPLSLIHEMRRLDFHREPHVTGAIGYVRWSLGNCRHVTITVNPLGAGIQIGAFHSGARLGLFQFSVTGPNPKVEMDFYPTYEVAFDPEGPARGQPVVTTLRSLRDHVEHVIFPELEPLI